VLEIAFGGLDQVRDQVVAPLQLHIDLREGVFVTVTQGDERVVAADHENQQETADQNDDDEKDQANLHKISFLPVPTHR